MSSKTRELCAIEKKYGLALFRMALTHLVDVGTRHLTDENVDEAIKQIMANDKADKANGVTAIMTAEFQCEIVRCAASLAKFDIWELFAYIKNYVPISD
jgi:hypothetical protein